MSFLKLKYFLSSLIYSLLFAFIANSYMLVRRLPYALIVLVPLFLAANIFAGMKSFRPKNIKLKICYRGTLMLSSLFLSVILSVGYHIIFALVTILNIKASLGWSILYCLVTHFIVFWNGIICVYCTSRQMNIRQRVIAAICGMIPVVNFVVLHKLLHLAMDEVAAAKAQEETTQ